MYDCVNSARFEGESRDAMGSLHPVNRNSGWSQKTDGSYIWSRQTLEFSDSCCLKKKKNEISFLFFVQFMILKKFE